MLFSRITLLVLSLISVVYLWLVSGVPVMLLGNADYDDALFCKQGVSLLNGGGDMADQAFPVKGSRVGFELKTNCLASECEFVILG